LIIPRCRVHQSQLNGAKSASSKPKVAHTHLLKFRHCSPRAQRKKTTEQHAHHI
jgi:hypothetical protein